MTHSAKFWNLLDERRTTAKKNTVCQISPSPPPINVDHSFRHYGHLVSGQHCAGGRGDVLPRFGILENSPKTVKCVINFATDWSFALQPKHDVRTLIGFSWPTPKRLYLLYVIVGLFGHYDAVFNCTFPREFTIPEKASFWKYQLTLSFVCKVWAGGENEA